jgi:hypothetical protein
MAANLQLYADIRAQIDGVLLTEAANVSLEKRSGLNPVYNIEGFGGMSQGATTMEVTIETNVPSREFQFNPDPYMRIGQVVELKLYMTDSKVTTAKGFITDATYSHSVNDAAKLSMKLLCRYSDFE